MKRELEDLRSDAISDAVALLTSPGAMRLALRKSEAVVALHEALARKKIVRGDVDEFLDLIRRDFQKGVVTTDDVSLAALAAALEDIEEDFAVEYLRSLASLRVAELPNARRVAAECLRAREERRELAADPEDVFILTGEFVMPAIDDTEVLLEHRLGEYTSTLRERIYEAVRESMARFQPKRTRLNRQRFENVERKEVELRQEQVRKVLERQ